MRLRFAIVLLLLRSIAVKHRHWLDIAEYVMLFGSGVGSLASVASQQVIYTAAPLSFLALLSVVNRHRLQQHLERVAPAVTRLDRRFSAEVAGFKQQVEALPKADTFRQLSAIVTQKHQGAISQLVQKVSLLQTELANQATLLEAHNLTVLEQEIQSLQIRSVNLEAALSEVTAYLNQVAAATRVNELEDTTAQFSADLTHLKTEVAQLQTHLQSLLDEQRNISPRTLQDQIDHLNRRLSNLPQPFDASLLRKDIDSLLSVVTDLVSRRELSRVAAEVEKLQQQNRSMEQAMTVVRLASNVLRKQLDTVSAKVYTREGTLQLPGTVNPSEPELHEDLKRAMTRLAKGLVALQKRFNQMSASPELGALRDELEQLVANQVAAMQQQLVTVQQATNTLEQEQQDLRQLIDRAPDTNDRTLSTQLSALIARIDWAEQRITQAEGFWSTLQTQVEATLTHQLESITPSVVQDLVAQHLQHFAIAQNTTIPLVGHATELTGQPPFNEMQQQLEQLVVDRIEPLAQQLAQVQQQTQRPENGGNDRSTHALPTQALEQLHTLLDRVEWAETHLGTLQQQINDNIQPQLDELSQQVQGLSPKLDIASVTLVDQFQPAWTEEVVASSEQDWAGNPIEAQPIEAPIEDEAGDQGEVQLIEVPIEDEAVIALPTEAESRLPDSQFENVSDAALATTWQEIPRMGRALLEAALAQTHDRIIIVSPYPTPETFDAALVEQFETVLQRGVQIDIGWGHLVDEQQVRLPRCLHQPAIEMTGQGFLPNLLRQLAQMKQRYTQQFRFKILGTHENFLVCDHAFAVIGVFPIPGEPLDNVVGLRNDDPIVVDSLIDRFDEPEPDPNNPIAYLNRGVTRFDLGDQPGAIADLTQALQHSPNDELVYNNRGLARFELGDLPGAMMDFNHALQLNPRHAVAYFNRGCTRTDLGDKLGAISDFSLAIDYQPDFAAAFFCRAIAYTRLENRAAAIADFSAVIALNPHNAMALFYRGVAHSRAGNSLDAQTDLRLAQSQFAQLNDLPNQRRVKAAIHDLTQNLPNPKNNHTLWPL